jgi:hypothetical protein
MDRVVSWSMAAMCVVLALLGAAAVWFAAGDGRNPRVAGVLPAGLLLAAGGAGALGALARAARGRAVVVLACVLIATQWLLVLKALPDFERFKPIPRAARAIQQLQPQPSAVGTYRLAAPSLVFYIRRHVDQMLDEAELRAFFASHPDAVCVMPAEEYQRVRAALPVPTRVIARGPRFDVRLSDILARRPLPEVVAVASAGAASSR